MSSKTKRTDTPVAAAPAAPVVAEVAEKKTPRHKKESPSAPAVAEPTPIAAVAEKTHKVKAEKAEKVEKTEKVAAPVVAEKSKEVESAGGNSVKREKKEKVDEAPDLRSMEERINQALETINIVVDSQKLVRREVLQIKAHYAKERKDFERAMAKRSSKRRTDDESASTKSGADRPLSGFAKKTKISDALCKFLDVVPGTEVSRTDVTKAIAKYITSHNLQNPDRRREFFADPTLKTILGDSIYPLDRKVPDEKGYSYFNLQRYLSKHFPQKASAAVTAPVATV